jgi:SAM-dependent methyltransferase
VTQREVIWHDVENGSYVADLGLWRELAAQAAGPILDLGAGTGRVALDLNAAGHEVHALDSEPELLAALRERAPGVSTISADARSFSMSERFALILAPMQLVQILGGPAARRAMLERVHEHLLPGGRFAAAIANPYDALAEEDRSPPYPDMIEHDGWVYSSQPIMVREQGDQVIIERHRQAVAPDGTLDEQTAPFALDVIDPGELEAEARAAGLVPLARHQIPETDDHIGSVVIECRR